MVFALLAIFQLYILNNVRIFMFSTEGVLFFCRMRIPNPILDMKNGLSLAGS